MPQQDLVSKDILKRIALDIARILMHLEVDRAELIETDYQRVEDRRADLVVELWGEAGQFILHVEIQNDNQASMPLRMLRYRVDIAQAHPGKDIRQTVIYIGKDALTMPNGLSQTGLDYRYPIIDMHTIDCADLLTQDNPDALVLAILCDFKDRPAREVVHYILQRLKTLTANNSSRYREYIHMLEILSTNRGLERVIEEEETMLSEVEVSQLPSFKVGCAYGERKGLAQGMNQGIAQGLTQGLTQGIAQGLTQGIAQGLTQGREEAMRSLLQRQLTRRFGPLDASTLARLNAAPLAQLEDWGDRVIDAQNLVEAMPE